MSGEVRIVGRDPGTGRLLEVRTDGAAISQVQQARGGADLPWLAPGLIDLQVNGYAGHDVNGADVCPDAVVELAKTVTRAGSTTFVPTIITAAEDAIHRSLRAVRQARERDALTRHAIPFVHIEGPSISPDDGPRGVHPAAEVRPPDIAEFRRWQEVSRGLVGMVTLSPHHPGSVGYTEQLTAAGVRVAIGHTHASPEEIRAVVDAGACLSTHLGNGAHATIARHPNYIWAQLAEDRLTAGFIADGHHLPGDTLTSMVRAKGLDRSILVSDSVALAGLPPGEYVTPVGGRVVLSADGRLAEAGTPYLAGAARPLADGIAGACRLVRLSLADAVRLATANPARFVDSGRVPVRGRLVPGARADLLLFDYTDGDSALRIRQVVAGGRILL